MKRIAARSTWLALLATFGMTGCCYYELQESLQESRYAMRTCWQARTAWWDCEAGFDGHPQKKYFGKGFRDGYSSICQGGDGCCPTVPPRECWGWCYDECEGQARMNAWFDGWNAGALMAQSDGWGNCGRLPYRRPGCNTCATGHCPIHSQGGTTVPPGPAPYTGTPDTVPADNGAAPVSPGPEFVPPSPPATTPAPPADEAYESYNADGVYLP